MTASRSTLTLASAPLHWPTDDDCQPCQNCSDSVIKRNKCLTIRKSWRNNKGNVSMVSRKLGLSRTTIYAHINRGEAFAD